MKKKTRKIILSTLPAFLACALAFCGCTTNGTTTFNVPGDTNTFSLSGPSAGASASRVTTGKLNAPALPASDSQLGPHAPGQVLIKFNAGDANSIASQLGAKVIRTITIGGSRYATLLLPKGISIVQSIQKLKANPKVVYAEPNWYRFYKAVTLPGSGSGYAQYQWAPADVNAVQVWQSALTNPTGDPAIVIGIADTGVNGAHQDFTDALNTNGIGSNVSAGFDYADNYSGSEGSGTTSCPAGEVPFTGGGCVIPAKFNSDPTVGHGTLVASTADANGDNGNITGICWHCTIEPIKLFGSNGNFTSIDLELQALVDAVNAGAGNRLTLKPNVINMSFGAPFYSNIEDDGINFALQNNIVLVAAAGNSANAELDYPAAYPGVIAVGATTANNTLAQFTTQGAFLALSAPGVQMYGASNTANNSYQTADGTSFSSPMVAGSVGLLDSLLRDNGCGSPPCNPALTPDQAASLLEQNANKSPLGGSAFSTGFGYGILNVLNSADHDTSFTNTMGAVQITVDSGGSPACDWDVTLENGTGAVADTLTGDSTIPGASGSGNPPYGQPGVAYAGVASFWLVPAGTYTLIIEPPKYASSAGQTCGTNSSLSGKETVSVTVSAGATATTCSSPTGPATIVSSPCTVKF